MGILCGGDTETYEPRFTYHGFRYVEVTGYPGKPTLDAIEGRFVHNELTDVRKSGLSQGRWEKSRADRRFGGLGKARTGPKSPSKR